MEGTDIHALFTHTCEKLYYRAGQQGCSTIVKTRQHDTLFYLKTIVSLVIIGTDLEGGRERERREKEIINKVMRANMHRPVVCDTWPAISSPGPTTSYQLTPEKQNTQPWDVRCMYVQIHVAYSWFFEWPCPLPLIVCTKDSRMFKQGSNTHIYATQAGYVQSS